MASSTVEVEPSAVASPACSLGQLGSGFPLQEASSFAHETVVSLAFPAQRELLDHEGCFLLLPPQLPSAPKLGVTSKGESAATLSWDRLSKQELNKEQGPFQVPSRTPAHQSASNFWACSLNPTMLATFPVSLFSSTHLLIPLCHFLWVCQKGEEIFLSLVCFTPLLPSVHPGP